MKPTSETEDPLAAALRAAYSALSPDLAERFPVEFHWEPQSVELGTAKARSDQCVNPYGSQVPRVPSENQYISERTDADALAEWEERAAIREFDGGMSRVVAEALTALELGPRPRT